jgi:hypothetical protein
LISARRIPIANAVVLPSAGTFAQKSIRQSV